VKRHHSPLHQLLHTFTVCPDEVETVMPAVRPPNKENSFCMRIASTREESRAEDCTDQAEVRAYSDGSGIDGHAGAAAVLYRGNRVIKTLRYFLGPLTQHTTYEAEVVGVLLTLKLLTDEGDAHTASIKLDNQAVILALNGRRAKSTQSLLNEVHTLCDRWRQCGLRHRERVSISWISGHDGIQGNELADKEAKMAVSCGSSHVADLPQFLQGRELPHSLTAVAGAFKQELHSRWRVLWASSPRRPHLAKIDAKLPSHAYIMATDDLTRAQASVLTQLRTRHVPLNQFLHRIGKSDSPTCPACISAEETVHHYIFDCPAHAHARHGLACKLGRQSKSVQHILGDKWVFKPLMAFVWGTERFKEAYGDLLFHME